MAATPDEVCPLTSRSRAVRGSAHPTPVPHKAAPKQTKGGRSGSLGAGAGVCSARRLGFVRRLGPPTGPPTWRGSAAACGGLHIDVGIVARDQPACVDDHPGGRE